MVATTEGDRLARLGEAIRTSPHNLVSKRAREELATRHIPECVAFARGLPESSPVLDLGSGGGLPGLVIAVVRPDLQVHLLEATAKKAAFLRSTAVDLALEVTVHHGRAEALADGALRRRFPVVTARAVAPLQRLVVWAEPFLADEGQLHAIKGERWRDEVADAGSELDRLGLAVKQRPPDDPPGDPSEPFPSAPRVVTISRARSGPSSS